MTNTWVFGYGSLIWKPGFEFVERQPATLAGWSRKFWQGSHDHRGTPESPGRVVTLVPDADATCVGILYLISPTVVTATFERLDYREKNGYSRIHEKFSLGDGSFVKGVAYIADEKNEAYLGDASTHDIAVQIMRSQGPSGSNSEYLLNLAEAIRALNAHDKHVFALEAELLRLENQNQ